MPTTFQSLGLSEPLVNALARREITEPFPVQTSAIPHGLAGSDIQGRAPTGSGKTFAFGLPLLSLVERAAPKRPKALVLAPTRELAEQIKRDLALVSGAVDRRVGAVYGGVSYGPQKKALQRGVDVLVATPGRLEDLIDQRSVELSQVDIVVIDEADRMADMGFLPAVRRILDQTRRDRQTLLFSATLDGDVAVLSRESQRDPVTVTAGGEDELDVRHHFWRVNRSERVSQTARVIEASGRTIIFTRTRRGADRLVKQLARTDVSAVAMHGGRSQNQRTRALKAFSSGKARALVATDVAARGIHVEDVDVVLHYDMANDHKDYVHRSGRTARAGATGTVISFVTEGQDRDVKKIQRAIDLNAPIETPRIDMVFRGTPQTGRARHDQRPERTADGRPGSRPPSGTGTLSIFVGNLPWRTSEIDLEALFAKHGTVERAKISTQRKSGRSKGFGFVDMAAADGKTAIDALNGSTLGGRTLRVRPAR